MWQISRYLEWGFLQSQDQAYPSSYKPRLLAIFVTNAVLLCTIAQKPVGVKEESRWTDSTDAVITHSIFATVLSLGTFPSVYTTKFSQGPFFLSLAALTIYIGSHRSLDRDRFEQITFEKSLIAPVLASVFLLGFYLLSKYVPDLNIQSFINFQFSIAGSFAVARLLEPFLSRFESLTRFSISLPEGSFTDEDGNTVKLSGADLVSGALGLACTVADLVAEHHQHTLNNLIACSIAIEVLQGIGIKNVKSASALLIGLMIYDVFWVFGSPGVVGENVMLKVAASNVIEGPMKLILPNGKGAGSYPFSILGLGDIVIPGFFAALMLRLDAFLGQSQTSVSDLHSASSNVALPERPEVQQKTYFTPALISYISGLLLAFLANQITDAGQPALLYIVPSMLIATLGTAVVRGELTNRLLPYSDPDREDV